MHQAIKDFLEETNTIPTLITYIAKKSRSNYEDEVAECANFSQQLLEQLDFRVEQIPSSGNPVILGKKDGNPNIPEILIYGHYDVQHEGDLSLWKTPPFEAQIIGDKLFGRGSADNKGQHFAHIKALEYVRSHHPEIYRELRLKFILDGDEERGSFSLADVFRERSSDFNADIFIVSDGPSLVENRPSIIGSVRGILTFQVTIQSNPEDLHSGNFGGLARSATLDMVTLLSEMIDPSGRSKIPGFYDQVIEPSELEKQLMGDLGSVFENIQAKRGYASAQQQVSKSIIEQNQTWPTININGIAAGGVKKQRRTIIPAEITASLDCRLVPDMNSARLSQRIETFISDFAIRHNIEDAISVEFEHAMEATRSSLESPSLDILTEAFAYGFESAPLVAPRLGGSLPLYLFPKYLGKQVFLIPLALPDENNHAPNENLDLPYFQSGVISMVKYYLDLYEKST